jgi:hypothetical protein
LIKLGSGFADYSSAASGLVLWSFSILVTRHSILPSDNHLGFKSLFRLAVISFGALALFYNLSRGAWIGMFFVLVLVLCMLIKAKMTITGLAQAAAVIAGVFIIGLILPRDIYHSEIVDQKINLTFGWLKTSPDENKAVDGGAGGEEQSAQPKAAVKKPIGELVDEEKPTESAYTRAHLYSVATLNILEHPFWGIGVDRFQDAYINYYNSLPAEQRVGIDPNLKVNAHNFVLSYVLDVGVVPFLPFAGLILLVVAFAMRSGMEGHALPFLMGLVALSIWLMVTDGFTERLLWIALAMASGLAAAHDLRRKVI